MNSITTGRHVKGEIMLHGISHELMSGDLVDPTPLDPFTSSDYLSPVNEQTPFRLSHTSYADVSRDLNDLFSSDVLDSYQSRAYTKWWMNEREFPSDLILTPPINDKQWQGHQWRGHQWQGNWQPPLVSKGDEESRVCRVLAEDREKESGKDFYLEQAEARLHLSVNAPSKVDLPTGGGFVQLEYETGAEVDGYFNIADGQVKMPEGTSLLTFYHVNLILNRDKLARIFAAMPSSTKVIPLLTLLGPDDSFRIPLRRTVLFDGRPYLELDFSKHSVLRLLFGDTYFIDSEKYAELGFDSLNNLTSDALIQLMQDNLSGQRHPKINLEEFFPDFYTATMWVRHLSASKDDLVMVQDGKIRFDFDSAGEMSVEGKFLETSHQADIDFHLQTDGVDPSYRGRPYRGWIHADTDAASLDLDIASLELDPQSALQHYRLVLPRKGDSPLVFQGGIFLENQNDQIHLWQEGDFRLAALFSPEEKAATVEVSDFHFPFLDQTLSYSGKVIWNGDEQSVTFSDLSLPLNRLELTLREGADQFPFLFSGKLIGPVVYNWETKKLSGPFYLQGRLQYLGDNQKGGVSLLPSWIKLNALFSTHVPYKGPIGWTGEKGNWKAVLAKLKEAGHTNRVASIDGIQITVNSLYEDQKSGNLMADFVLDTKAIELHHPVLSPPVIYSGEEETSDDPLLPIILKTEKVNFDDQDIWLQAYHLDAERVSNLLGLVRNSRELNLTFDHLHYRRRTFTFGPFVFVAPKDSEPILEIRVVDGQMKKFHFYSTKPFKLFGVVPLIRGFYYDPKAGCFRLDLINGADNRIPIDFYRVAVSDPVITNALFKMLPLPSDVVEHLLKKSNLNPRFLENAADGWLKFFFMSLMAMEKKEVADALSSKGHTQQAWPIEWENGNIEISNLQLNRDAKFTIGGYQLEFGGHDMAPPFPDEREGNNQISGVISLADSTLKLSLHNIGKLHIKTPAPVGESQPFDMILWNGTGGSLEWSEKGAASVLTLSDMTFDRALLGGSPMGDRFNMQMLSALHINEVSITEDPTAENNQTRFVANLELPEARGDITYREGQSQVQLALAHSDLHVTADILLEDVDKKLTTDVLLKHAIWTLTSDDLRVSCLTASPGISFTDSHIYGASVVYHNEERYPSFFDVSGNLDLKMEQTDQPVIIPLAQGKLFPNLTPQVAFHALHITGPAHMTFQNHHFFAERDKKAMSKRPLNVSYSGLWAVNQVADLTWPDQQTHFSGNFSGAVDVQEAGLTIPEKGHQHLGLTKVVASNMDMDLDNLNTGELIVAIPTVEGFSKFDFTGGKGTIHVNQIELRQGEGTKMTGVDATLEGASVDKNFVALSGDFDFLPGLIASENFLLTGNLYDEINGVDFQNFKIESNNPEPLPFPNLVTFLFTQSYPTSN